MKKIIGLTIISLFIITGCSFGGEKTLSCKRIMNQNNMKVDLEYTTKYKGKYVIDVNSTEKITTDNEETLELMKDQIEKTYEPYSELKHYEYNVVIENNVLTSTVKIDYSKIDVDKMIEIDSANKEIFKDGKMPISYLRDMYTQIGASCN